METGLLDRNGRPAGVPLKEVEITGKVLGGFADITVTQVYKNTGKSSIEVIYTFPLPDTASVYALHAELGDRTATGETMEKENAVKRYDSAVMGGDSAFLMEQYRPNIFQVSLGHIQPGETATIRISYIDDLKEIDNELRLSIPTVAAPRYITGSPAGRQTGFGTAYPTDRVPDADFITPPVGEADYHVNFKIEVDSMRKVASYESPSHKIKVRLTDGNSAVVSLAEQDVKLDRDFVLVCRLKTEASSHVLASQSGSEFGFIYAAFVPEIGPYEDETGREYIFLIDISGSMQGEKLEQARNALKIALRNLTDKDSFNMVAFESSCHYFNTSSCMQFNQSSLEAATKWIDSLGAMGGTEILEAIRFSLQGTYTDRTILLFTDGEVGNENEIFSFVRQNAGNARIFAFGIDTAVNTYFINRLSEEGNGIPEFVHPGERIDDKVIRQFSRITSPVAGNMVMDWGGTKTMETVPEKIKNIFNLEPVSVLSKYQGEIVGNISLKGTAGGCETVCTISSSDITLSWDDKMLARLWARGRIRSLESVLGLGNPRREEIIRGEIINISMQYGVISSLTSFVAVLEREDKASGLPATVVVPVLLPDKWEKHHNMRSSAVFAGPPAAPVPSTMRYMRRQSISYDSCNIVSEEASSLPTFLRRSGASRSNVSRASAPRLLKPEAEILGRQDLVRILARNQQADGIFANRSEKDVPKQVRSTADTLVAFTLGDDDISMYRRQLGKGLVYLTSILDGGFDSLPDKLGNITCMKISLALKLCLMKDIPGTKSKEDVETIADKFYTFLTKENIIPEKVQEIFLCNSVQDIMRNSGIVLEITGVARDGEAGLLRDIQRMADEADAVSSYARLCILKSL